jgi:hypothetical protein
MKDEFFDGVEQADFYYGDLRVREIMPDRRFEPAQILPGVAAVQISAFQYYEASIPPYNEFAVCIPLNSQQFLKIPGYNMLRQMLRMEFDLYFHHIMVTDEIALTGREFGYPKFMATVDFTDTDEWIDCDVGENGQGICRLRTRRVASNHSRLLKFFCHIYHDRQPHFTEGKLNARQYGMSFNPSDIELSLDASHPIARELSRVLLTPRSIMSMYVPDFQMILYGNQYLSIPLLRHVIEDGMRIGTGSKE